MIPLTFLTWRSARWCRTKKDRHTNTEPCLGKCQQPREKAEAGEEEGRFKNIGPPEEAASIISEQQSSTPWLLGHPTAESVTRSAGLSLTFRRTP